MDKKFISTCDGLMSHSVDDDVIKFSSFDENNDIFEILLTKNSHNKCTYEIKFKQWLTICKTKMTMQFKL